MTKNSWLILVILFFNPIRAQDHIAAVEKAFARLVADSQLQYGLASFYVVDFATGKPVFDRNGKIGLVPASCQKVITAAAALEILGKDFRYETKFGYAGPVQDGVLVGKIMVQGSGDPTLGSDRFQGTRQGTIGAALKKALQAAQIKKIQGGVAGLETGFETSVIPKGWIWEDIGNYYGAGHSDLNWHENQYDLWLRPGRKPGDPVVVIRTVPSLNGQSFSNELTSGKAGSGDNAFLYFIPGKASISIRGTIPCCIDSFRISGAVTNPADFSLRQIGILSGAQGAVESFSRANEPAKISRKHLYTHYSPGLDSIIYWFLQKSINLYGEALVHTISQKIAKKTDYDSGLSIIRDFWALNGINKKAINIIDGSGLSPQNRVTAEALVKVMLFAKSRPWFNVFYDALPLYNGIKMKSGTISGVKTYTGFLKNKSGKEYAFAIMVNNYSGSSSLINKKLYEVLDSLK